MKKFIIILSLIILAGCGSKNKFEEPIKASLIKDALGIDIKPKFNTLDVIDTIYVGESKDHWYSVYGLRDQPRDSSRSAARWMLESYQNKYKEDPLSNENDVKVWHYLNYRITELEKHNDSEVDYFVVKANYTFLNPLVNQRITNERVYILSNTLEVLYSGDIDEWKKYEYQFTETPLVKYETAMCFKKEGMSL